MENNNRFSIVQFLLSVNGFVYALFGAFLALIGLGIICAGSANLGVGRLIGQIPKGGGVVMADAYREIYDLPTEQAVSLGGVWEQAIGTRIPDVFVSTAAPTLAVNETPGFAGTPAAPTMGAEMTPNTADTERVATINQALLKAQEQWYATGDYGALLDTIGAIDAQVRPGETYGLRDRLVAEASEFKVAIEAIAPGYQSLLDGGTKPSDPVERLKLAIKLQSDSDVVLNFLNAQSLVNHPGWQAADVGKKTAEIVIVIVKAAADASVSTTSEGFWDTVSVPWASTKWTIIEFDAGLGSTNTAVLRAESPNAIKGINVRVYAQMLQEHFPDQTGPLTEEVGQVIVFPAP